MFIGEQYDDSTNLSYLNARYYDGGKGRFLSQDPVFQNLGIDERTSQVLADPQLHNPYSYGRNNPIANIDDTGEISTPLI